MVVKDVMVRDTGDEPTANAWGRPARIGDIGIDLPTKPDADVISTTKVGDKTNPTPHGFYYEFIKDEKPYAVRDMNRPNLILCKCENKAEAGLKVVTYEREATEARGAAPDGADVPQVQEPDPEVREYFPARLAAVAKAAGLDSLEPYERKGGAAS